ncbi:MAG TPA: hypothetical protein PK263_01210 [bacterium]|nr:hypothetical protein [bacterium]
MIKKLSFPKIQLRKPDLNKVKLSNLKAITADKYVWIKLLAALSYIHVLVILPLVLKRKNQFVDYHVRQGIALLVVWIVFGVTFYLPVLPILFAFYISVSILIGIINIASGKERPLPIIGRYVK